MDLDRQKIEAIHEAALDAGDDVRASMAGALLIAEVEFGKQTDALRALAVKARSLVVMLRATGTGQGIMGEHVASLQQMVSGVLDGLLGEPMVRELHYEGGAFRMGVSHWAAAMIGHSLAASLQKTSGDHWNYVEMEVTAPDVGRVAVIVQRRTGKTPSDMRKEAETKAAELYTALQAAYCPHTCQSECVCGRRATLAKYKDQP